MKLVKIQQEIIKNYHKLSHDKNNKIREKIPIKYARIDNKVHLAFRTYIVCFTEDELYIDLEKLNDIPGRLGITNFEDEICIKRIISSTSCEPNASLTGNIKKDGSLEMIEISNGNKLTYVDKKILDIFECQKFYFNDVNSPVTCYDDDNEYLGIILPIAVKGNK